MRCKDVESDLLDLVEGRLPPAEAEALRGHVAACATCAQQLAAMETVLRAVAALPRAAAPENLWLGVRQRIRVDARRRWHRRERLRRLVPALMPLAATAVLLLAAMMGRYRPAPPAVTPFGPREVTVGHRGVPLREDGRLLLAQHRQLANEAFVGGDDLLVAECAFPPELIGD